MRVIIVANCQVQPLARGLQAIGEITEVLSVPVHLYGTKHFEKYQQDFDKVANDDSHVILTFVNGDGFDSFSTDALIKRYPNVHRMTNIYFSGLHPDITYLGDRLGRLQSPVGDYHSKLVLYGYISGMSVMECVSLFNGKEYEKHDYFSEFDRSAKELVDRDEGLEIRFATAFLDSLHQHLPLYTINHPTGYIFQEYVSFIARHLSLDDHRFPLAMLPNFLANSAWWPVYPEIAEEHKLEYRTPMVFRQPDHLGGKNIALENFIGQSYKIYKENDDRVRNTRQVHLLIEKFGLKNH